MVTFNDFVLPLVLSPAFILAAMMVVAGGIPEDKQE